MVSEQTIGFEPADTLAKDPESVRKGFWAKFKRVAATLPFAEDLLSAYYCAFDRRTPRHVQAALLGAIAYFILPFDFIPDMLPVLGFTDDAAVLAHRDPSGGSAYHARASRGGPRRVEADLRAVNGELTRLDGSNVKGLTLARPLVALSLSCFCAVVYRALGVAGAWAWAFCSASQALNCLNSASLSASDVFPDTELCLRKSSNRPRLMGSIP